MTKELIENIRTIIVPYMAYDLRRINYENMGEIDAEQFKEDMNEILDLATKALEQQPEDAISRETVEDKLLRLCNELEGIFSNIREKNVDDSVCGLCEYDCDHGLDGYANECPGFERDDCFKLADEIRHEWQSTKDLPPVQPKPKTEVLNKIRAEIEQGAIKDVNGSKYIFVNRVNQIIDKYKAESEE